MAIFWKKNSFAISSMKSIQSNSIEFNVNIFTWEISSSLAFFLKWILIDDSEMISLKNQDWLKKWIFCYGQCFVDVRKPIQMSLLFVFYGSIEISRSHPFCMLDSKWENTNWQAIDKQIWKSINLSCKSTTQHSRRFELMHKWRVNLLFCRSQNKHLICDVRWIFGVGPI